MYRLSTNDVDTDTLEDDNAMVMVYPVPVGNALFIEMHDELDTETLVSILTMQGRLAFTGLYLKASGIDATDLKPGVYYLEVIGGNGLRRMAKFVKK
jgi:hypothetical protein